MDTKKLRQKILDLAIHGKLVPQDPNDEPASVLLERIKAEKERLIKEGKIKRTKKSAKSSDTPHYQQDVPYEVPENWVWTTLGEICLFLSRGKSPKYSDTDKTYPVFAQKCNLKEGGISLEQARFLDPSTICKWSEEYKLKTGDVLVNSTGTGTVGRTRLFHESYLKHYPFAVPDSHVSVIRTASEIKSEFVFAYISSKLIQEYLEDNLAGSTNQKELYIGVLSDLSFPLPPFAEQQRIVKEIEYWFVLIDQIEQDKSNLQTVIEQTKSKILDLAIHGKLVPQDPNDEPASELLKRINPKAEITCDNGHYPFVIPSTWIWHKIGTVAQVITGSTPSKSIPDYYGGSFPFYKPSDLDAGRHVVQSSEYLSEKGKSVSKIIPSNSIAICCIGSIGKIGYIEKEGTTNQQINTILPRKTILNPLYCYYVCSSSFFVSQLIDLSSAITISIVNKSRLQSTDIPLPPISEQQRIVAKIEELFSILDNIQKSLEA